MVEDKEGNLFVATGDEGKLYKVAQDGKVSVAYTCADSQILCLALGADGSVYAGTGPAGQVVRIAAAGQDAKVVAEDLDSYVWSLAVNEETKTIYAGTGPKGRIYQVTPEGKGSVFYTTKQEHILCLARTEQGHRYAGTDKGGLVYRITPRGKGFVLYQAPQGEVRSLLVSADGVVYAGTSAPVKRHGGDRGSSVGASSPPNAVPAASSRRRQPSENRTQKLATGRSTDSSSSSDRRSRSQGQPCPGPVAAGNGRKLAVPHRRRRHGARAVP